jgi:hypothetical protein
VNPGAQTHTKLPTPAAQVPPLRHGDDKHTSALASQNSPVHPGRHSHRANAPLSTTHSPCCEHKVHCSRSTDASNDASTAPVFAGTLGASNGAEATIMLRAVSYSIDAISSAAATTARATRSRRDVSMVLQ